MPHASTIQWNSKVRMILTDVDDTIAPPHEVASPEICQQLEQVLAAGAVLFCLSGSSVAGVNERIVKAINAELRYRILIGHCNGAEVWGYDRKGDLLVKPFYSAYNDRLNQDQKLRFRETVHQLIREFNFQTHPVMPRPQFQQTTLGDPLAIMFDDRKAQITFELHNAHDLQPDQIALLQIKVPLHQGKRDMRTPVIDRANELFEQYDVPITARRGGVAAIDMTVEDVSKTTAVEFVLHQSSLLSNLGLNSEEILHDPNYLEVWGDRFSESNGTDWQMSVALDPQVRSIDFRSEDPGQFPPGYNIKLWDGQKQLAEGLLEYIQSHIHHDIPNSL